MNRTRPQGIQESRTVAQVPRDSGETSPPRQPDRPALSLEMSLPGQRLDMVLAGAQPRLIALVQALARTAAQRDHEAALRGASGGGEDWA